MDLQKLDTENWTLTMNQTHNATEGLSNGTHYYFVAVEDILDNVNQSETRYVNITGPSETNTAPKISYVSSISSVDLTEASVDYTEFYFVVNDSDGLGDINISSAVANFTRGSTRKYGKQDEQTDRVPE